ncbi:hypothetical protein Tcan_15564 [Toxocara canis]|uniref:Uncharacterized protein n=2 Tax=Toxocara canis TaxID=6265 RepID=A0A0B2VRB0_TOXCA|nr:hypothetical protein Tcan_15564 [Toxocara canis]VDM45049.1 unnamed protein product [Toxocara canis]
METIAAEWIGKRKTRVLSRSLTGPSLAAPSRIDVDPNILKVKSAHSADGSSRGRQKHREQDSCNELPRSRGAGSLDAGMGELARVLRSETSVSPNRGRTYYRVLEFLSCGSIEAATNIQMLCSNRIGYLLNLTGIETLRRKTAMACNCGVDKYHHPIERSFDIESEASAQVLIFNADGQDSCQAMALQYIMQYHGIPLKNAWEYLKNIEGGVEIKLSENFNGALRLWDMRLEEQKKSGRAHAWRDNRERPSSVGSVGSFHSQRKIAWI